MSPRGLAVMMSLDSAEETPSGMCLGSQEAAIHTCWSFKASGPVSLENPAGEV